MLDQIFGRLFLSQWIVFAVLLVFLIGLSELAWRIGLAGSRKKSEADKDSGTVRSAVLALLGLCLDSVSLSQGRGMRRAANFWSKRQTRSSRLDVERSGCLNRTLQMWRSCCASIFGSDRGASPGTILGSFCNNAQTQCRASRSHVGWGSRCCFGAAISNHRQFIASLNETIDFEAKRVAAKHNHVPGAVWLLLLCVAGCGVWLVSYPAGTSGRHSVLERFVFSILIAIVIAINYRYRYSARRVYFSGCCWN